MKELLIKLLEFMGVACWIEIKTDQPKCIYYFGPFLDEQDALTVQKGYVEDLEAEKAQGIQAKIKRCKPQSLTIFDEKEGKKAYETITPLSGQAF